MTTPAISVIIPAFNAARTLPLAFASIHAQQVPQLEIVVVDDGSTDDTRECCMNAGAAVRYMWQKNSGAAAARNAGIEAASGTYITFLDSDDEWVEGCLPTLLNALEANDAWCAVQGRTAAFAVGDGTMDGAPMVGEPWHAPTVGSTLFRRSAFDTVGKFNPKMVPAEDLDWFVRARECGCVVGQLPDVTLRYRLHPTSLTRGLDAQQKNLMLVLKRSLDRRRQSSAVEDAS